jgi:hypothetical protein
MDSLGPPTPRATDDCSPRQLIIFYRLLTYRTIYDMPSTVTETREAPSMLRVNDGMRTRSTAGRSTTPELSRQRPQLAVLPGDGRETTTTTPLPGTDIIPDDRRTHAECLLLLRALRPSNGLPTSRYPMSTNMNLSRIQGLASRLHHRCSSCRGVRRRDDRVLTHCPWARRAAMAATFTPTLHRRLGRLQSMLHR